MMQGKTPQQQADTLLNIARSKGIDVNEKRFSVADIQKVFNNFPQR
jgi:predicted XRE-type DNA-binding protein